MVKETLHQNETVQPNDREIAALREYFPACFKDDGSFDIERLREFLSDKLTVTHEGYELKFLGKNYARLLASLDTTTVIVPDEEHNAKPENSKSENIYISGDNLDGLKHLLKSYSRRVKCIYIDPPYNTGSDGFVYNDSFNFSVEELSEKLSINEEQAQRVLDLAKRGSASHSAWLMFMYPRLLLARDLLTDDGVIFISIDDNEQGNLKLLCDDVFGEENFVSQLVWEKKKKGSFLSSHIVNVKEYILVYAREKASFGGLIGEVNSDDETYPCIKTTNARGIRTIKANTPSKYREKNYTISAGERISSGNMELIYLDEAIIQDGVLLNDIKIDSNWIYSQEALDKYADHEELYITQDLYIRRMVTDERSKKLKDLLLRVGKDNLSTSSFVYDADLGNNGWGTNEDANDELHQLLGTQYLFDYSKPSKLISKLAQCVYGNDFIMIDFFAGSATTMQSVFQLNAADGGKRQCILVQLPENLDAKEALLSGEEKKKLQKVISFLDETGFPHTLDYIGIERIIRAAKAIREANPLTTTELDLGFKHYTLAEPSQNTLDKLEKFDLNENTFAASGLLSEFGKATVLTTWLNHDGYGLTAKPEEIDFAGYKGYFIGKHLYLIDEHLSNEAIEAILTKFETDGSFNPENVILFGYSFLWTEREALQTNLKRLKDTEKNLRVNFDIRY
ncbi:MAG: site-specific DNA-methyltransferase [Ruminococcaceae bacterium]|nr:site-specific DNA-methyltransferase [Oscillospiraceae bacterium]